MASRIGRKPSRSSVRISVLRDEKERERLAETLEEAIREAISPSHETNFNPSTGEREINDSDVYLGLSACNREEACSVFCNWECLDRFEEHLTHGEQVGSSFLISSDARTFKNTK